MSKKNAWSLPLHMFNTNLGQKMSYLFGGRSRGQLAHRDETHGNSREQRMVIWLSCGLWDWSYYNIV